MPVARDFETVAIIGLAHSLEPLCHPLGIAIEATRTYLGATRNWIPRRFRPFYLALVHFLIRNLAFTTRPQ